MGVERNIEQQGMRDTDQFGDGRDQNAADQSDHDRDRDDTGFTAADEVAQADRQQVARDMRLVYAVRDGDVSHDAFRLSSSQRTTIPGFFAPPSRITRSLSLGTPKA